MNIILLDKIANLGGLGDQVTVKSGYARNFLFPQGKAVPATKSNVEKFEQRRAELEAKIAEQLNAAQARAEKLNALEYSKRKEFKNSVKEKTLQYTKRNGDIIFPWQVLILTAKNN